MLFHIISKHQDEIQQLVHKYCRYMYNRPKMTIGNKPKFIIDSIAITKIHKRHKVIIDNKFKDIKDSIKLPRLTADPASVCLQSSRDITSFEQRKLQGKSKQENDQPQNRNNYIADDEMGNAQNR